MSDQQSPIIQSVLEQAKQAFATQQAQLEQKAAAKQRQDETIKQSFIDALKKQLEQDIRHELFEFLQIEYKIHESGTSACRKQEAIACIKLPNEYDILMAGYILAQSVTPNESVMQPGYRIIIPDLSKNNGSKTIYSDLSGGCNHYCVRGKLNESLLTLIGKWDNQVAQLKDQLEQQRQQYEQQQKQERLAREETERLKAQQEAEFAQRLAISDQINQQITALIDNLRTYSKDIWRSKTLIVYKFAVNAGTYVDEDENTSADKITLWSLQDTFDDKGYIVPPPGSNQEPCKPILNATVLVHQVKLTSTDDCARNQLTESRPDLLIKGIANKQDEHSGLSYYVWDPEGEHRYYWNTQCRIPVKWVRLLLSANDPITSVSLKVPEEDIN